MEPTTEPVDLKAKWSCPACGAENDTTEEIVRSVSLPFMPKLEIKLYENTCKPCGMRGDFRDLNDPIITAALRAADDVFVKDTVAYFKKVGINPPYIERVLSIPFGTLNKWSENGATPEGVALLRVLRTCPWIIEHIDRVFSAMRSSERDEQKE